MPSEWQPLIGDAVGDAGRVSRAVVAPVQAGDADEGAQFLAHSFLFASGGLKKKSRLAGIGFALWPVVGPGVGGHGLLLGCGFGCSLPFFLDEPDQFANTAPSSG